MHFPAWISASLATYGIAFGSWCLISASYFSQTFLWVHGPISSPGLCYWNWGDEQGVGGKEVQASACKTRSTQALQGPEGRQSAGSSLNKSLLCLLQESQELYQNYSTYRYIKNCLQYCKCQGKGRTPLRKKKKKKACKHCI